MAQLEEEAKAGSLEIVLAGQERSIYRRRANNALDPQVALAYEKVRSHLN